MVYCCICLVLLVILMIVFMNMKDVIVGVTVQDVESGLNISATIHFTIVDKVLTVIGGVDIGLIPSPLPPIIQVILVYHWGFIVMVTTEVVIGIRPEIFICIAMLEYSLTTKGSLKKLFQGLCKEKPASR